MANNRCLIGILVIFQVFAAHVNGLRFCSQVEIPKSLTRAGTDGENCVFSHKVEYRILHVFASVKLMVTPRAAVPYVGYTKDEALAQLESGKSPFSLWTLLNSSSPYVTLDPAKTTFIAVSNRDDLELDLKETWLELWNVGLFTIGLFLFLLAPKLSRNAVFFYGTGVSVGMLASVLILLFILTRLIPKRSYAVYGIVAAGWSFAGIVLHYMYHHFQGLLSSYSHIFLMYFAVAGVLSFALCYWYGAPTEPRRVQLIQWGLQLLAVLIMYLGLQLIELLPAVVFILFLMTGQRCGPMSFLPRGVTVRVWAYWHRVFPPKPRLLTEEEYIQQGIEETERELEKLRQYCQSPECNAWKTVSRLQDPSRFASFIDGDSHLSDDEERYYEESPLQSPVPRDLETDDESNGSGDVSHFMLSSK